MVDGRTADARLERLLHVLPAAMQEGGADLEELAAQLHTSAQRIIEDIEELTARSFYQPGGWPDDVQILLDRGRVRVWRAAGFERPTKLDREETLCVALALRGGAASAHLGDEESRRALLERVERHLGRAADDEAASPAGLEALPRDPDMEGVRETLIAARRERRPCALWYVKAGADDGSVRVVHPYAVCYAEGAWYTVAYCATEEDIRVFRLDRVLACDLAAGTFDIPEDLDPASFVQGGKVFYARDGQDLLDVRVRYSPRIARWVRERAQWEPGRLEEGEDGSVYLRHAVADPHWAVGHALQYGADAEIVEPEEVRGLVRDVVEGLGA